jgi:hypothetical protein
LSVFGANGTVLLPDSQQSNSWQGILPATQDYYFRITGGNGAQNFALSVIVAARTQFSQGQNQITLNGQTVAGYPVAYAAYALGGQKMDVSVNTNPEKAALTIWGFSDGQPTPRPERCDKFQHELIHTGLHHQWCPRAGRWFFQPYHKGQ